MGNVSSSEQRSDEYIAWKLNKLMGLPDFSEEEKDTLENFILPSLEEERIRAEQDNTVPIINKVHDNDGKTPLQVATQHGRLNNMKLLLDQGADVNAKDKAGQTALYVAVQQNKNTDSIKLLLDKGADINTKDKVGRTALHIAVQYKSIDSVKCLLDEGADINTKNMFGQTALHIAVEYKSVDIIKLLLGEGADINIQDEDGKTAVNMQDKYGRTVLHIMAQNGNSDSIKHLLGQGADINAKDKAGQTALHIAVQYKSIDSVKCLLDEGGDINAKDNNDKTPEDILNDMVDEILLPCSKIGNQPSEEADKFLKECLPIKDLFEEIRFKPFNKKDDDDSMREFEATPVTEEDNITPTFFQFPSPSTEGLGTQVEEATEEGDELASVTVASSRGDDDDDVVVLSSVASSEGDYEDDYTSHRPGP